MNENRLPDYLDHIQQAATDVCSFVEGLAKDDFLTDKRTQQAVILSLIIIGEAATKVMEGYAAFTQAHPEVPWRNMRGMRNRMAHGYFDIDLNVVGSVAVSINDNSDHALFSPKSDQQQPAQSSQTASLPA